MKKGYFYTLDAVIAIIILIMGLIIIAGFYLYAPEKERTGSLSDDVTSILNQVKVEDVCTSIGSSCSCSYSSIATSDVCRWLRKPDISLMELLGLLYHKKQREDIDNIIEDLLITPGIVPENYEIVIHLLEPASGNIEQLYPLVTP